MAFAPFVTAKWMLIGYTVQKHFRLEFGKMDVCDFRLGISEDRGEEESLEYKKK